MTVPMISSHARLIANAMMPPLWKDSSVKYIPFLGKILSCAMNASRYEATLEQSADFIASDLESYESPWSGKTVGIIDGSKWAYDSGKNSVFAEEVNCVCLLLQLLPCFANILLGNQIIIHYPYSVRVFIHFTHNPPAGNSADETDYYMSLACLNSSSLNMFVGLRFMSLNLIAKTVHRLRFETDIGRFLAIWVENLVEIIGFEPESEGSILRCGSLSSSMPSHTLPSVAPIHSSICYATELQMARTHCSCIKDHCMNWEPWYIREVNGYIYIG